MDKLNNSSSNNKATGVETKVNKAVGVETKVNKEVASLEARLGGKVRDKVVEVERKEKVRGIVINVDRLVIGKMSVL